jgi:hypothetical protein
VLDSNIRNDLLQSGLKPGEWNAGLATTLEVATVAFRLTEYRLAPEATICPEMPVVSGLSSSLSLIIPAASYVIPLSQSRRGDSKMKSKDAQLINECRFHDA